MIADPAGLADHRGEPAGSGQVEVGGAPAGDHTGTWLPANRQVTGLDATDPLAAVVAAEDARFAAMVAGAAAPRSAGRVRAARRVRQSRLPKWPRCWEPAKLPRASWRRGPARPSRRSPP